MYGLLHSTCGRHEESIAAALTARELDPLSVIINMGVAWSHHFAGRHEDAIRESLQAQQIVPGLHEAGNVLIGSYEEIGRLDEAARLIGTQPCWGLQFDGDALREALRTGGPAAYWCLRRRMLEEAAPAAGFIVHYPLAVVLVHLGEVDAALDHVEQMIAERLGGTVFIAVEPTLSTLRGNARYDAIVKRVGVPLRQTASAPHTTST